MAVVGGAEEAAVLLAGETALDVFGDVVDVAAFGWDGASGMGAVAVTDFYVMLVASGVIQDVRFF